MKFAVISSFPRGTSIHGTDTVGGASYTKNLLLSVARKDLSCTVYGDILENEPSTSTVTEHISVSRTWKRSSFSSLFSLFTTLLRSPEKLIIISFEAYMFGSLFFAGVFLGLMTVLRISSGKKLIFIVHQVPGGEFFSGSLPVRVLAKVGLGIFYSWIRLISTHCVVFEEYLKQQLGFEHVSVIPHAVERVKPMKQAQARKQLNIPDNAFVALYFGYIAGYKGLDQLIKAWPTTKGAGKDLLILAGGPNKHHESEPEYRKMVSELTQDAHKKGIIITGFVPEEAIKYYFSACDVVVLPYQHFMSSSGPLSLAFSYEKPHLLSDALHKYFMSDDMKAAADQTKLKPTDICVAIQPQALHNGIGRIKTKKSAYVAFSRDMKKRRAWKVIAEKYVELLRSYETY